MPSRRFHSKTRHGCDTCKQSKVRCDLQRPICKRCTRLDRPCSFANEADQPSLIIIPSHHVRALEKSGSIKSPGSFSPLSTKDLEFMHHYSTSTCLTMTDDATAIPIWRHAIPKQAFQNEFLLHGLLSLAALHQRHTASPDQLRSLVSYAAGHQSAALATYIPLLQSIDQENCHALFAFSQLLPALSFAFLQYPEEQPSSTEFVNSFVDIFDLLIGATVIAVEGKDWLRAGDMGPVMRYPFAEPGTDSSESDVQASLDAVMHCFSSAQSPITELVGLSPDNSEYNSGVELLTSLFPHGRLKTIGMARVIGWPVFAGAPYLALLKKHDPKSLVILAHYGAALHANEDIWYLKDLGGRLVRAVFELVDPEWQPHLSWPLSRISV